MQVPDYDWEAVKNSLHRLGGRAQGLVETGVAYAKGHFEQNWFPGKPLPLEAVRAPDGSIYEPQIASNFELPTHIYPNCIVLSNGKISLFIAVCCENARRIRFLQFREGGFPVRSFTSAERKAS